MKKTTLIEQANEYATILNGTVQFVGPNGAAIRLASGKEKHLFGPATGGNWHKTNNTLISLAKLGHSSSK